ncbi:MAG: DnaJ domain-containing protein [Acidimicrobiia bacterium]|nr:DnaJ domain-containing protein [Acidimicrobiia bacterium]
MNHYLVLGVERNATRDEIETAFRLRSTMTYGQFGGGGAGGARTAELEAAYTVLTDPVKRAAYDRQLDEELSRRTGER